MGPRRRLREPPRRAPREAVGGIGLGYTRVYTAGRLDGILVTLEY